jgi:hypothetical protein
MQRTMKITLILVGLALCVIVALIARPQAAHATPTIVLEAAKPVQQQGSTGDDQKAGSPYGHVLGMNWGGHVGDYAEYTFDEPAPVAPAILTIRYARDIAGSSHIQISVDGKPAGLVAINSTGGWGDNASQFTTATIALPNLSAGQHTLRMTVPAPAVPQVPAPATVQLLAPVPVLELVGQRADKNTVGHGKNVALYTGLPSQFFYATQNMTDVFSAVDGQTIQWFPDYVLVTPQGSADSDAGNADVDQLIVGTGTPPPAPKTNTEGVFEQRQVCVTKNDVVVSRIFVTNTTSEPVTHRITVQGDCRKSFDFRGGPGGTKGTQRSGDTVVMTDGNVFPDKLPHGLTMAIGASLAPTTVDTATPGTYTLNYDVTVPPGQTRSALFACAFDPVASQASANLQAVLHQADPLAQNRQDWKNFYSNQVPSFTSSDSGLDELYAFRWFLLLFSRAGGDLGYFHYPVDMEGRQAFQTYCCFSAPFMAFDLNWQDNANLGFGQIANLPWVAYPDGRFPWYTTPETNRVPVQHASRTGQSLMPWAAWKFYQIQGRKDMMAQLYPGMKKNMDWWIRDRDPDHSGLFRIDDQLETGMDDLHRRWKGPKPAAYQAIDATCYAILNLKAVANMARLLGKTQDASYYAAYAAKATHALNTVLWDPKLDRYRDRNPNDGELSDYNSITIFYPMFADVMTKANLVEIKRYLMNPHEYLTKYPVPALSQSDPEFDPVHRYWAGPTWPATNSHVLEGFADTAKRLDRTDLPEVATLFHRIVALQLRPRADFYEHYNSLTGEPESTFRDYMHSWWIDTIIRQATGLTPQDDGGLVIDPLPLGLKYYALRGAPYRGHRIDVFWNTPGIGKGLTIRVDGKVLRRVPNFQPGGPPITLSAAMLTTTVR